MGKDRKSAIGSLVERTTLTIILVPLKARDATTVRKAFEKEGEIEHALIIATRRARLTLPCACVTDYPHTTTS